MKQSTPIRFKSILDKVIMLTSKNHPTRILFDKQLSDHFNDYKKNVFLNPNSAPWDRSDSALAHSKLFNLLFEKRVEVIYQELEFTKNGVFLPEWSRRADLIPANVLTYSNKRSIDLSWKEPELFTTVKDWAEAEGLCVIEVAACMVIHSLYISKKLGKEGDNIIRDSDRILSYYFSCMKSVNEYAKLWLKPNLAGFAVKDFVSTGREKYVEDTEAFGYYLTKTLEEAGLLSKHMINFKKSYSYNFDKPTTIVLEHKVSSEWHNLDDIILVRHINDPKLFDHNAFDILDETLDFEMEFSKYLQFCNGNVACLEYPVPYDYLVANAAWITTEKALARAVQTHQDSGHLLREYLDLSVFHNIYKASNDGCPYLIDGVEYDKYYLNLVKTKRGN